VVVNRRGSRRWSLRVERDGADLEERAGGDELGDADRRPRGVGLQDVAILDGGERVEVPAEVDVVGRHLGDLAERRTGGGQVEAQVLERLLELRRRVAGDVAVRVRARDAGEQQQAPRANDVGEAPVGLEAGELRDDQVVIGRGGLSHRCEDQGSRRA
jgi:hypothetical protein